MERTGLKLVPWGVDQTKFPGVGLFRKRGGDGQLVDCWLLAGALMYRFFNFSGTVLFFNHIRGPSQLLEQIEGTFMGKKSLSLLYIGNFM